MNDNISKIDAQLLDVGHEIRDCELAAAAAAARNEFSERDYYRDEEKQLRDKEKQLRKGGTHHAWCGGGVPTMHGVMGGTHHAWCEGEGYPPCIL